jgi:hypothetical protein
MRRYICRPPTTQGLSASDDTASLADGECGWLGDATGAPCWRTSARVGQLGPDRLNQPRMYAQLRSCTSSSTGVNVAGGEFVMRVSLSGCAVSSAL